MTPPRQVAQQRRGDAQRRRVDGLALHTGDADRGAQDGRGLAAQRAIGLGLRDIKRPHQIRPRLDRGIQRDDEGGLIVLSPGEGCGIPGRKDREPGGDDKERRGHRDAPRAAGLRQQCESDRERSAPGEAALAPPHDRSCDAQRDRACGDADQERQRDQKRVERSRCQVGRRARAARRRERAHPDRADRDDVGQPCPSDADAVLWPGAREHQHNGGQQPESCDECDPSARNQRMPQDGPDRAIGCAGDRGDDCHTGDRADHDAEQADPGAVGQRKDRKLAMRCTAPRQTASIVVVITAQHRCGERCERQYQRDAGGAEQRQPLCSRAPGGSRSQDLARGACQLQVAVGDRIDHAGSARGVVQQRRDIPRVERVGVHRRRPDRRPVHK